MELNKVFIKNVRKNYPTTKNTIIDAYKFAYSAHEGIKRKSGEPYIVHPVAVAQILMDNHMDHSTIIAGLLHDVVEDTEFTLEDIEKRYGKTVAKLVDGVTKINELNLKSHRIGEQESIKHLLLAMGNDIRVIFIKLADRLHNMRTIEFLSREKQLRMAKETQELFIPIAERIGIRKLRNELQSLTFDCLHPEESVKIKTDLARKLTKRQVQLDEIQKDLSKILKNNNISSQIVGWPEHAYSIFKKTKVQGISKIYCLMLFKIIVPTEDDCYRALGVIHKNFKPVPGQVKDHIADPKANGYQSLHSVVVSSNSDITFKVMIRTSQMDQVCEYGISSMWQNRDETGEFDELYEKHNILKDIITGENLSHSTTSSFIDAIKTDLSPDVTWILTPKLKPICVSVGNPIVLDFAYAVHTNIGNNAVGAIVNGKKCSLKTQLKGGDVVQILLSEEDKAPSREWLSEVKSAVARRKIREYINKHTTEEFISLGKKILEEELAEVDFSLADVVKCFDKIKEEYDFASLEDMYASVGYKGVKVYGIAKHLLRDVINNSGKTKQPVKVAGDLRFANINFPKCCCPIFGDEIVGVGSRNGLTVHTKTCSNLSLFAKDRIFETVWQNCENMFFDVYLKVVAKNTMGFGAKLLTVIAENNYDLSKLTAKSVNKEDCEFSLCFRVANKKELEKILKQIKSIDGVKLVGRSYD